MKAGPLTVGYTFSLGPVEYVRWAGTGEPFTLVDCLRETRGVGDATIYRPDGTVVLRNAGSLLMRANIRRHFQRRPSRNMRSAYSSPKGAPLP